MYYENAPTSVLQLQIQAQVHQDRDKHIVSIAVFWYLIKLWFVHIRDMSITVSLGISGIRVSQPLVCCVVSSRSLFLFCFLLDFVLFILLWFKISDYPLGICKLFFTCFYCVVTMLFNNRQILEEMK